MAEVLLLTQTQERTPAPSVVSITEVLLGPIPSADSPALAASMEAAEASTAAGGTAAEAADSSHEVFKP